MNKTWEEQFEQKHYGAMPKPSDYDVLIADVKDLLAQQRKEIVERIERLSHRIEVGKKSVLVEDVITSLQGE